MASYFWDLGVDWNAVGTGTNNSNYYLQSGFIKSITGGSAIWSTPVYLGQNDNINFAIYDVTSTPAGFSLSNFTINCQAAVTGQSATQVFSSNPTAITPMSTNYFSMSFAGAYPTWMIYPLQISASLGKFLLSFSVQATVGSTTRTYTVDPEMVVGENG